jgi:hypothetical protein
MTTPLAEHCESNESNASAGSDPKSSERAVLVTQIDSALRAIQVGPNGGRDSELS